MELFGQKVPEHALPFFADLCAFEAKIGESKRQWWVRCKTPNCHGRLTLSYRKSFGQTKCTGCTKCLLWGEHLLAPWVKPIAHRVVAMSRKGRGSEPGRRHIFWLRCKSENCFNVFNLQEYKSRNRDECVGCAAGKRMLHGIRVISDKVWNIRDKIVGVKMYRPPNSNAIIRKWLIACANEGCSSKVMLHEGRQNFALKCDVCRAEEKSQFPYQKVYKHLKCTWRSRGAKFTLSYRNFVRLASIPYCFYCRSRLPRKAFLATSETTGYGSYLDRIKPKGEYSMRNVVPCCKLCNTKKSDKRHALEMLMLRAIERRDFDYAIKISETPNWKKLFRQWCYDMGLYVHTKIKKEASIDG